MRDWKNYIKNTKDKRPSSLMTEAFAYVPNGISLRTLELGAGAMNDVRYMQERGFKQIDVVDIEPEAAKIAPKDVHVYTMSYERFSFPENAYDFVNAQYSLPFAGQNMEFVMEKVKNCLKSQGVFSGVFFGPEDEWASDADIAVVSGEWVKQFFNPQEWSVHKLEEEKGIRPTAAGDQKHWHVFSIIASRAR